MPAVFSGSDPFKGRTVLYGGNAPILRVVAHTNVDGAAAAHDADLLDGRRHLFGSFGVRRGISLPRRLLRFLFGDFCQVLVLTPGETVDGIEINEMRKAGDQDE